MPILFIWVELTNIQHKTLRDHAFSHRYVLIKAVVLVYRFIRVTARYAVKARFAVRTLMCRNIRAQKESVMFAIPILYTYPILSTCHVADWLSPGPDCGHKKWWERRGKKCRGGRRSRCRANRSENERAIAGKV